MSNKKSIKVCHKFLILHIKYKLLVVVGQKKTSALLSLINHQSDTDEIYLYIKDTFKPKY